MKFSNDELNMYGSGDESSYTTRAGFPICNECGKSTRNRNATTCAPCRKAQAEMALAHTFTAEDRKFLSELKVRW